MIHALIALAQALTLLTLTPVLIGATFYIIKYRTDMSVITRYGLALIVGATLLYFALFSNKPILIMAIFLLSLPIVIIFILFVKYTITLERRETQ